MDFNNWIISIRELVQEDNSWLKLRNGHWSVKDRVKMWEQFSSRIFDVHLDLIKEIAVMVLSEVDPQFDLPPEERFYAAIRGKTMKYSSGIRKGMAETLALIGCYNHQLINCTKQKPEYTVILTIREIFEDSDWKLWASINNLLPVIAEASPDEFLNVVQNALKKDPCPFDELFTQEGTALTGGNYMTGLLWGLESIAWSEEYLSRVILILAELAAHDPGGTWSNRPINSITTILLPWMPQTVASVEKRINAIKPVRKEFPDIAWKVLLKLLPNQHQVSFGSSKSKWRKFIPDDWKAEVTNIEYWEQVKAYAELAVNMANIKNEYLIQLLDNLDNLPAPSFQNFLEYLSSEYIANLSEEERQPIWEKLSSFVNKHRRYAEAKWALDSETVNQIEIVANKLVPDNPRFLYRRLFTFNTLELFDKDGDWKDQQNELEEKRQNAVRLILASEGLSGILEFIETIEHPSSVGWSLGAVSDDSMDDALIPDLLINENKKIELFIGGYVSSRYSAKKIEWVDNFNHIKWSVDQICQFLMYLPFESDIWSRVESWLGDRESEYWKKIFVNPYPTQSSLYPAIDKLLKYGRPRLALECIAAHNFTKKEFDPNRAIKALLDGLKSDESTTSLHSHNITEIISKLQSDITVSEDDLFRIEFAYLALLDRFNGAEPKTIERRLSSKPEEYCELLRYLYRSTKEDQNNLEQNDENEGIATNVWELLHNWRSVPGIMNDGSFSSEQFLTWYSKVKELSIESGHFEVAMNHLGHVLFYSPEEKGVLWIHTAIAEILNDKDGDDIRRGYTSEVYNARGVYTVDPSGKQEREIAEQWRKKAEAVEAKGFVRFATSLRDLAKSFDRDAERVITDFGSEDTINIDKE